MDFKTLWKNYPDYEPCCDEGGNPNFMNQCTMKLSECFRLSGFPFQDYDGEFCWYHGKHGHHVLRIEELVLYLKSKFPAERLVVFEKKCFNVIQSEDLGGKSGIVALINFSGFGNQEDHIDLFDGTSLRNGELDYFERSDMVFFWEIPC